MNTAIVIFHMEGCPACEEYIPRAQRIAQRHPKVPFYVLEAGAHSADADRFNVNAVPATFALRKPHDQLRIEGSIPDAQIEWLFNLAEHYA